MNNSNIVYFPAPSYDCLWAGAHECGFAFIPGNDRCLFASTCTEQALNRSHLSWLGMSCYTVPNGRERKLCEDTRRIKEKKTASGPVLFQQMNLWSTFKNTKAIVCSIGFWHSWTMHLFAPIETIECVRIQSNAISLMVLRCC